MKKVSVCIAVMLSAVVLFSYSKPPTFKQDMEAFKTFLQAKELDMAAANSHEDSVAVIEDILLESDEINDKWDVEAEFQRTPFGTALCSMGCIKDFLLCVKKPRYHDPEQTLPINCYNVFGGCVNNNCL